MVGQAQNYAGLAQNYAGLGVARPARAHAGGDQAACFGGQGSEPNEQNTQQSPSLGRSRAPHFLQS